MLRYFRNVRGVARITLRARQWREREREREDAETLKTVSGSQSFLSASKDPGNVQVSSLNQN